MIYESVLNKLSIANQTLKREKDEYNRFSEQFKRKKRFTRLKSRRSLCDIGSDEQKLQSKDETAAQLTLKESQIKRDEVHEIEMYEKAIKDLRSQIKEQEEKRQEALSAVYQKKLFNDLQLGAEKKQLHE